MSTTPITNIYHPDNATPAQDVTTLGAMADSIETAMLNLPRKFADFTALEAWTPANGALAFVQADGRTYVRVDGVWRPIQARHITDNATGRVYFGTGDDAGGVGATYLGMSPASETGFGLAFWVSSDGSEVFRVYKSGNARVYGDLQVDGSVTQSGDVGWTALSLVSGFSGLARYRRVNGVLEIRYDISGTITGDIAVTGALPPIHRPSGIASGLTVIPTYIDPGSARATGGVYISTDSGALRATAGGGPAITRIRGSAIFLPA